VFVIKVIWREPSNFDCLHFLERIYLQPIIITNDYSARAVREVNEKGERREIFQDRF